MIKNIEKIMIIISFFSILGIGFDKVVTGSDFQIVKDEFSNADAQIREDVRLLKCELYSLILAQKHNEYKKLTSLTETNLVTRGSDDVLPYYDYVNGQILVLNKDIESIEDKTKKLGC